MALCPDGYHPADTGKCSSNFLMLETDLLYKNLFNPLLKETNMVNIKDICSKLFKKTGSDSKTVQPDPAIQEFKTKYWNFKNLLAINQKVLEIMSEMEQTFAGDKVYGYSFLRKNITELSVCMFRVITLLDRIAPEKYNILLRRFEEIHSRLYNVDTQKLISEKNLPSWICRNINQLNSGDAPAVGSKAANLGEIQNIPGISVPDGFVLSSNAYQLFIDENNLRDQLEQIIQCINFEELDEVYEASRRLKELVENSNLPGEIQSALQSAYKTLETSHGVGVRLAVRSSATGEDGLQTSFAGQYVSVLEVSCDDLESAYKKVLAGKYNARALIYRHNKGLSNTHVYMSVAFLVMQDAVSSGVIYTSNPETGTHEVVVSALPGLPKALVDGSANPDLFTYSRGEGRITSRKINEQKTMLSHSQEHGMTTVKLNQKQARTSAISDNLAIALARTAIKLENHFKRPQDIEWCVDPSCRIVILQTRPLQLHDVQTEAKQTDNSYTAFRKKIVSQSIQPILKGGITASRGVAIGSVFLVAEEKDAARFPRGGILVARDALPRWSSLVGKAGGLITDHGAAAGHLATVAREFNVPALFNTSSATTVLASGDQITLDASACEIFEGRLPYEIPDAQKTTRMYNTPVYSALKDILSLVRPLNLTDPHKDDFIPENCRTYHDILRFCHEKAVDEIFCLGQEYQGAETFGKRLIAGVPTQWWLIDLGGGFKKQIPKDKVKLSEISSQPFLKVWEGMISHAWQGPPGADVKGLFSIMMESTMNRDLDLTGPSSFNLKNYALVSGNFCSLNCRFGYHYSVLQALCKEPPRENYIRFGFKGGAADMNRKRLRLKLMMEIMEGAGFRVKVTEDSLNAAFEAGGRTETLNRLKVLGYLIVHTRQMDMVMSDQNQYDFYLHKIHTDISNILE